MNNVPDYIFTGTEDYPIGSIISKAGDVNSDSLSDILFCYPTKLYYGDSNLNFSQYKLFCSNEENDNFGSSLSNSGDINNDGYSDILIGALNHRNTNNIMVGKTYCYLGVINMDTIADFSMEGETKWGQFSQYLCIGGDINNDGYDEVMVGAPNFPDHTNPLGKVYIYSYENFNSINENMVKNNITTFKLYKNYPNPFNSTTTIVYELFYTSEIKLEIYNCSGQRIKVIKKGLQKSGFYSVEWKGTSDENMQVSNGVYFIRLSVKSHQLPQKSSSIQKLVLIK